MSIVNSAKAKILAFFIPFSMPTLVCTINRLCMSLDGSTFDPLGVGWIIFNGLTNGFLLGLLGMLVLIFFKMFAMARLKSLPILGCLIFVIYWFNAGTGFDVPRDRLIRWLGYTYFFAPFHPAKSLADLKIPEKHVAVLPADSRVEVINEFGKLEIVCGRGMLRRYLWQDAKREIQLYPDPASMGLVSHLRGERFPGFDWKDYSGINRCKHIENVVDFPDETTALQSIRDFDDPLLPLVYTPRGMVIGFSNPKRPCSIEPDSIVILVWQITINGKKPEQLPQLGLHKNTSIRISHR